MSGVYFVCLELKAKKKKVGFGKTYKTATRRMKMKKALTLRRGESYLVSNGLSLGLQHRRYEQTMNPTNGTTIASRKDTMTRPNRAGLARNAKIT